MDFIAGLPGQNIKHMVHNMDYICHNLPENVTIHTLAIKRGSPLYDLNMQHDVPDESIVKHMVQYASGTIRAGRLCAVLSISPTIYERSTRKYWVYIAR